MSQEGGETSSGSKRMRQTDAERALGKLLPALKDFEHRFTQRIQGPKKDMWRLRLEIYGEGPRITDVDLNDFVKVRPAEEPT